MGKWTVEGWIGWLRQGYQTDCTQGIHRIEVGCGAHLLSSNLPRPKTWLRVDKTLIVADTD